MSLTNPNHAVTVERLSEFYQEILPYLNGPELEPIVYGIRILRDESVPSAKIEYLEDAIDMTPAGMNFSTGVFDYGSWENAFFMPKPCMLKYDGTVDYYLDPNDYTKKEDGTASDVANTSYEGNAMMEWPKIWLKIVPDATKDNKEADIFISNQQVDEDYHDWSYHNSLGESVEHFYTAIYISSLIDNKYRSISNHKIVRAHYYSAMLNYAKNLNPTEEIWTIENISGIKLITVLLMLIGKTTNMQDSFGFGINVDYSGYVIGNYQTGVCNNKGLFYGTNSGLSTSSDYSNSIKIFGMENWWGLAPKRYTGEILNNSKYYYKFTYGTEDGSTRTGFNTSDTYVNITELRNGYIDSNITFSGNNSYIKNMYFNSFGFFPSNISNDSSGSTYYCDYFCANSNGSSNRLPLRDGVYNNSPTSDAGPFAINYNLGDVSYEWIVSFLSAHPLS